MKKTIRRGIAVLLAALLLCAIAPLTASAQVFDAVLDTPYTCTSGANLEGDYLTFTPPETGVYTFTFTDSSDPEVIRWTMIVDTLSPNSYSHLGSYYPIQGNSVDVPLLGGRQFKIGGSYGGHPTITSTITITRKAVEPIGSPSLFRSSVRVQARAGEVKWYSFTPKSAFYVYRSTGGFSGFTDVYLNFWDVLGEPTKTADFSTPIKLLSGKTYLVCVKPDKDIDVTLEFLFGSIALPQNYVLYWGNTEFGSIRKYEDQDLKYIPGLNFVSNVWGWLLLILGFGWIWMWFV
ncbi:MAG: hypothetical protein FWF60_05905 [Oscillospiraceae bacterium]|nr:hypothetical protein [Oscillospiraceae bacterium]